MYCKPKMMAPIVHPTKQCVQNTYSETIVPHVHPQHTTTVNNQFYKHIHSYPQSQSVVNNVQHQNFNAGPSPAVAGAQTGPWGMGPGPGMSPYGTGPMVAGAQAGPGMSPYGNMGGNMPPMVGGQSTGKMPRRTY